MNPLFMIMINMAVAGFVGGITNHLAIKMLFHPRRPVYIGGRKIPFTPGLIPKRKDEIAVSLGQVVGEYLVTSAGLNESLQRPDFRQKLIRKLEDWLEEWTSREETLEECILAWKSPEQIEKFKAGLKDWLQSKVREGAAWLWMDKGVGTKELKSFVPGWNEQKRSKLAGRMADLLAEEVKSELMSLRGERLLRQMISRMTQRSGGFLGALAGFFVDEDKLLPKVQAALFQQLDSQSFRATIQVHLDGRLAGLESMTLAEAVRHLAGEEPFEQLLEHIETVLPIWKWLDSLGSMKLPQLTEPYREVLKASIPKAVDMFLRLAENRLERVIEAIELPAVVEAQVSKFPIERIEEILLSVSGKEFRAITWLGVLLGSFIGLFQSVFLLLQQ
ncbi:DUF445 family protein [Paenibacillus larvae]